MRHGLLLTAVATVTVPGLLAVLAVRAHDHVSAESAVTMAAAGATALSGTAAATAPSAGPGDIAVAGQAEGMSMLAAAAAAGLATSYQGTELISQTELDGGVSTTSRVWHQGGGKTVVQDAGTAGPDAGSASPAGVFGVTKTMVAMLGQHYVALSDGGGSVAGRTAAVVELYRLDGSLAATYWLDKRTMVPLRRDLFDPSERLVGREAFTSVRFGALSARQVAVAAWLSRPAAQPAWVTAAAPAEFLASLAGAGWRLPGRLPDNLALYQAASSSTASGQVVDLDYADGLYDVSLFAERGTLAADMSGWQRVTVDGQPAYASGHAVTWSGGGFVYTVIADAPPQTVAAFAAAIPRSGSPGVLGRLGRGFTRLGRLIDPFA